jgi:hypothetical protein
MEPPFSLKILKNYNPSLHLSLPTKPLNVSILNNESSLFKFKQVIVDH